MRQRTVSRSRARSQIRISAAEEDDLRVGLQRFLDKLRQHQPLFTEDDVTAISFPPEGSSSSSCVGGGSPHSSASTSPRHSPSRADNEEATLDGTFKGGGSSPSMAKCRKVPAASPSTTGSPTFASASVIDLDVPLSAPLFLTAVNIFEAKLLSKSKRVSTDALKLVRQAYALVWRDPGYLATLMNGDPCLAGSSSTGSSTTPPDGWSRRPSSVPLASSLSKPHLTCQALFSASAPAPTQRPDRRLALQLDECIRTLLVYANTSVNLCQSVSTNTRTLLLLAFVTCAARRLEEEDDVPYGDGPGSVADIVVGNRNLHAEMKKLESLWRSCGIEGRVADYLRECYLVEFLLDAALPPAVCSARYDGLQMAVHEKKQRIISDVVASRAGFASMMRMAPLRGLCGLANMSAFGNSKLRARLLDKMASEGVVERLAAEMAAAMEAVLAPDTATTTPAHSSTKRPRQSAVYGGSPAHQRSRAGASRSASRQGSLDSVSPAGKERRAMTIARASTSLERLLDSDPTPVERIGQCVDILMLLTCPDLRPPDGGEESPSRSSTSSASAVVRSTTWASRDAALHEICLYLLAICFVSKTHARYAELSSLQLYAADCMLQCAAYSGAFYAMVVHAMDVLIDMIESMSAAPVASVQRTPLSSGRASCSRLVSPQKNWRKDAEEGDRLDSERGRRVLQHLLPGDEAGLLPLLTNLLQYTIHAQANAKSIRRWFGFLADRLLPEVFEAPQLTTGRRSSATWGLQQQQEQRRRSQADSRASRLPGALGNGSPAAADGAFDAPVLARDLTRAEVVAAAPYFCFARRAVEETSWRDGTELLFAKVVLLAFHVIVTQGHRCNLLFGQACACYDVVAPVLLLRSSQSDNGASPGSRSPRSSRRSSQSSTSATYRRSTLLMHLREDERASMQAPLHSNEEASEDGGVAGSEERETKGADEEKEVFIGSTIRRRSLSTRQRQRGSAVKGSAASAERHLLATKAGEDDQGFSPFIQSPSRSLVFYEACSPSDTEASSDSPLDSRGSRRRRSSSSDRRSSDGGRSLGAALDEAAFAAPTASATLAESPEAVTHSWTGRLSLRSLLSSIGGHSEAPLLDKKKRA
ncbi:conserved hypothetical protein [Leishmania infantum JPCM5]|uniref:Uncharacterized protein n=2 Tax=Leishmania infantum TaxID=5671 RepID=A4I8D0_LEIIN|nr:conserved hypothetical protein [Leishmania infantum JPCM5]CAC9527453.1 hypothetical_protein_-_conserved [Leishmania infantum]CAM71073.1 conserved hypothetical protein [Leishmania infantum JPCM5]SUZ44897.1 hypothetical_protein_-_conserved [Leishmania infantum]|eukprot:XP_001467999.1 conserved hypothetical protein [Leishmania infantum JPCM5]